MVGRVSNVAVTSAPVPRRATHLHVGRIDRFEATLAQHFVNGARIRSCGNVLGNLFAEALLDELVGAFALAESGNPRLAAVLSATLSIWASTISLGISTANFPGLTEIGELVFTLKYTFWI